MFKINEDPSVTRIGLRMRRGGINELPHIFNIMNGDMSLVGPAAEGARGRALRGLDA